MPSKKTSDSSAKRAERRTFKRRPILATFSVFLVIPHKGMHRLEVLDISENGIGFNWDTEGETPSDYAIHEGDTIDLNFYLNPSLFIPLSIQVVRVDESNLIRRIGAEFQDKKSQGYKAYLAFIHLLDHLI